MKITTDFPGGNIKIIEIIEIVENKENIIKLKPDFRDTNGDWFYWAFCVQGAAGQTLKFDFSPYGYIGYHGPAVSDDLKTWRWADINGNDNPYSFAYSFGEHEDRVYFAHDMLYGAERFYSFADKIKIKPELLCVSKKGRDLPVVGFGDGKNAVLFTARHHCCESTGSYMLEGILEEFYNNPVPDYEIIAVPFVDFDGVIDGDQGKNRKPHDHNRDYGENSIYESVKAIKNITLNKNKKIKYAFDLHSPWHTGGRNDKLFFVRGSEENIPEYIKLGEILAEESGGNALKYDPADDINPGEDWNVPEGGLLSFARYFSGYPGVELALTVETPYFGCKSDIINQDKLVFTGRAFARAVKKYIKMEKNNT